MERVNLLAVAVVAGLIATAAPVTAQTYGKAPVPGDKGPDGPKHAGIDQKLGATVLADLEFYDHDAKPVRLGTIFADKPAVLILHYNRCPKLCNEGIHSLLLSLNDARAADAGFVAGKAFNVVLVSVDPREAPVAARKNREMFHAQYDRRDPADPGVWFLTASHGQGTDVKAADRTVHALADAVGFRYSLRFRNREYTYNAADGEWYHDNGPRLPPEPRNYDYEHAPAVIVVTPSGKISRYFTQLNYTPRDLRMAIVEASDGKVSTTLADRVAQFCFAYDQVTGHYKLTMRVVAVAFAPVMLLVVFIAYRAWRQGRNEVPLAPGAVPDAAGPTPTPTPAAG